MSPETHTGHGEEAEEEEEGAEISTVIEKRGRGRNRHARVVGGRLLFRPVGSLNGDTCSVNSPPPVCKLEPCMLVSHRWTSCSILFSVCSLCLQ